ncbi:MAG TPA: hypothetical protein VKW06_00655 [Candidatus Angelobacter sp.]|nr:hypothetical protein [Candidatus Angelobacter sp.]
MAISLKFTFDDSAIQNALRMIKQNPFAHERVCLMLNAGRFRELFTMRSEPVSFDTLLILLEPTPALLAICASVMN